MSTLVFGVPVSAFVFGSVVWKLKLAGMLACSEMPTLTAVASPVLMIVTKAVAGIPTCTDRLAGNTAATNDCADAWPA
jgi:hypothetical protein